MSYVSPSSSSEGSTRRFYLYIVYRPDTATSNCENSYTLPALGCSLNLLFNASVRRATNTEFNVVVLGRN
ncbi:hypothetical protein F511_44207 [Dorcoceras hygrometricum]|uniref:Uncharacterized protein n=1 Tax=Dorcoceras hygrometricum TaxID=472368 RepID=A0A2Z7ANI0_9LAMI|nr:hypothetical protein F511_44207 [Dorcoceras hygrometricum]